jgi:hypothetical protein
MPAKPTAQSAEADLAFLRSIVEGDQRPPMTLAICYLAGGLLYGVQCLFHLGQMLDLVRWPDLASLIFVVGITAAFLAILTWAILTDSRNGGSRRGTSGSRTLNAAFSATGMTNAAVVIVFAVGAVRDGDFAIWLYYAAIVFALQAAAWYVGWTLRRKGWMLATALGGWATAVALGVLVREPFWYLVVCTVALFLLFALPGWNMFRLARAPQEA